MTSSKTTVYERRNIAPFSREDEQGHTETGWEYDERTYSMQEYAALMAQRNADTLDAVEAQSLYTALMTDTLIS